MDFQIREPLHPLLGGLRHTNVMMETQAAQEYVSLCLVHHSHSNQFNAFTFVVDLFVPVCARVLAGSNLFVCVRCVTSPPSLSRYTGQQIHAVNLVTMWGEYLAFDTQQHGNGSTIARLLSGHNSSQRIYRNDRHHIFRQSIAPQSGRRGGLRSREQDGGGGGGAPAPMSGRPLTGMACVSNLGSYANWTGHVLAGSNTYGFGRLSWDPTQSAEAINREWAAMTFPLVVPPAPIRAPLSPVPSLPSLPSLSPLHSAVDTVTDILQRSRSIYEGYTSPLGIGFIVFGGCV